MNGFVDHGLDEAAFGEKKGLSNGLRSFDAFRMPRPFHGAFLPSIKFGSSAETKMSKIFC